jgi:hypothetical protein
VGGVQKKSFNINDDSYGRLFEMQPSHNKALIRVDIATLPLQWLVGLSGRGRPDGRDVSHVLRSGAIERVRRNIMAG